MFVKSTRFKQVCQLLLFSGKIFDAAEFLCDDVTLWAKLFFYKPLKFRPDL